MASTMYADSPVLSEGLLDVSDGHMIFYQVFGQSAPDAPAAIFLHGGPGGGCNPTRSHRFFDPSFYKIVVFDQRGCGRSQPNASTNTEKALYKNNTWTIVEDIEKLRVHVGVSVWHLVMGGSWGSSLALAYSQTHTDRVRSIVLRGVFLFLQEDLNWLFEMGGASEIYPDEFERYLSFIPEEEHGNLIEAYYKRLTSPDDEIRFEAARRFVGWELAISKVHPDADRVASVLSRPEKVAPFALFECAFFKEKGFLSHETQLLDNCATIAHLPVSIVHGRQDVVCRPAGAWKLHKRLPRSNIEFIAGAGHSNSEPDIEVALVKATDGMKNI